MLSRPARPVRSSLAPVSSNTHRLTARHPPGRRRPSRRHPSLKDRRRQSNGSRCNRNPKAASEDLTVRRCRELLLSPRTRSPTAVPPPRAERRLADVPRGDVERWIPAQTLSRQNRTIMSQHNTSFSIFYSASTARVYTVNLRGEIMPALGPDGSDLIATRFSHTGNYATNKIYCGNLLSQSSQTLPYAAKLVLAYQTPS